MNGHFYDPKALQLLPSKVQLNGHGGRSGRFGWKENVFWPYRE